MDSVKGKIVVTSKERTPYDIAISELEEKFKDGEIEIYEVSELASAVVWMFKRACDAAYFADNATKMGFEYVHREVS